MIGVCHDRSPGLSYPGKLDLQLTDGYSALLNQGLPMLDVSPVLLGYPSPPSNSAVLLPGGDRF
jgi:hypothetical protein